MAVDPPIKPAKLAQPFRIRAMCKRFSLLVVGSAFVTVILLFCVDRQFHPLPVLAQTRGGNGKTRLISTFKKFADSSDKQTIPPTSTKQTQDVSSLERILPQGNKSPVQRNDSAFQTVSAYDLRQYGPFVFLEEFRNPCWWSNTSGKQAEEPVSQGQVTQWSSDGGTSKLVCLPYFYLAGFPKCGTTDLYARISMHPQVVYAPRKEPHWLTRTRYKIKNRAGLDYYTSFFATSVINAGSKFKSVVVGDGSASTFWDNSIWRQLPGNENCSEPCVIHADYVRHLNPDVKIIVILRNPTDRLYSEHNFFRRSTNKTHFHACVVEAVNSFHSCLRKHSLRYCVYEEQTRGSQTRIQVGVYHVFLQDWWLRFPRDQLHVMRLENMQINSTEEMSRVFAFLGLDPLNPATLAVITKAGKRNVGGRSKSNGPMLQETRTILDDFYRPYNQRLADILHDEQYLWLDKRKSL